MLVDHSFAGRVAAAVTDRAPENVGVLLFLEALIPANFWTPKGDFSKEGWPALADGGFH